MAEHGIAPPAFRLPAAAHVGAVRLQVSDLERSLDYYERVVGLCPLTRDPGTAGLGPEGGPPLVWLVERPGARPVPRRGLFGLYHFALLLPERAALGRFVAHALRSGVRFGAADHLVSEALYLTDPDGLGIEVYADRPESGWRHAGPEIVMATEALNLGDLQEAGGDRAWEAAPSGTVVGHVHFHVGDLVEAEAFYHRALGLDKTVWSYPGALFFAAGRYHHHVGTNTWSPGPSAADDQARLLDWELVLPDDTSVEAALRSLHDNGFPTANRSTTNHSTDPWGTRVRITAAA